jgi:hypothetical protein
MTRAEIILMADASGISLYGMGLDREKFIHHLEAFAKLVAQHEREACAWVCDSLEEQCEKLLVPDEKWPTPADCANIIRARGQA